MWEKILRWLTIATRLPQMTTIWVEGKIFMRFLLTAIFVEMSLIHFRKRWSPVTSYHSKSWCSHYGQLRTYFVYISRKEIIWEKDDFFSLISFVQDLINYKKLNCLKNKIDNPDTSSINNNLNTLRSDQLNFICS